MLSDDDRYICPDLLILYRVTYDLPITSRICHPQIRAELPGLKKENVKMDVTGDTLTIRVCAAHHIPCLVRVNSFFGGRNGGTKLSGLIDLAFHLVVPSD